MKVTQIALILLIAFFLLAQGAKDNEVIDDNQDDIKGIGNCKHIFYNII